MLSSGSVLMVEDGDVAFGAAALGAAAGAASAGFSTRKIPPHELQRALTPPAGTFAGSTGNDCEHDGHVTVMTIGSLRLGYLTAAGRPRCSSFASISASVAAAVGSAGD